MTSTAAPDGPATTTDPAHAALGATGSSAPLKTVVQVEDVEAVEVAAGILRRRLQRTGHARGWIVDFAPGARWPDVDVHATEERYYVLSGEVIEGEERHGPGTYVVFAPGSRHRPRSEKGATMLGITVLNGSASAPDTENGTTAAPPATDR
ncbi:cupin domain-containing protein [Streptomyces sp. NPDC101393]|uniref:cupin domain-containing protein n=1 Tax=Streptomyces sp. NPDC101393 TaxID=3366141 RepID=UPI0038252962